MRTIILGDIHNKIHLADEIINKEKNADQIVFIGDFFDDFDDTPEIAEKVAIWLKKSLQDPKRVHIWGNHDLPYAYPKNVQIMKCPGNTPEKIAAVKEHISGLDWLKLVFSVKVDNFLISHAGFHEKIFSHPIHGVTENYIQEQCNLALECAKSGIWCPFFGIGRARYGTSPIGGPLWLDWFSEFKPIPNINQIVGHTPLPPKTRAVHKFGENSENYCIDNELYAYAILQDGKLSIEKRKS